MEVANEPVRVEQNPGAAISGTAKKSDRFRFRFRIWHLFVLVAMAAGGLWFVTELGKETVVIVLDDYQILKRGNGSWLKISWRYEEPERCRALSHNIFVESVPQKLLNEELRSGQTISFRYRTRELWILPRQDPYRILWDRILKAATESDVVTIGTREKLIDEQASRMRRGAGPFLESVQK